MKCILPFFLMVATTGLAQQNPTAYDFSKVDPGKTSVAKIDSAWREAYFMSPLDSLRQLREFVFKRTFSPKYAAFIIGYTQSAASLEYLNSGLRTLGLPEISPTYAGIPFGFELRGKRSLFSYLLSGGLTSSVANSTYTVDVRGFNFELLYGYNLLNSRRIQFYPFAALAIQNFTMTSFRNAASADVISINEFVLTPSGTTLSQTSWAFTYGAELDFRITNPLAKAGLMLGFRYGRTQTFAEGKFKVDNNSSSFSSPDRLYGSFFSGVLKVFVRM